MLEKTITAGFLKTLEHLHYGQPTVQTPDGKVHGFSGHEKGETATFTINDWRVIPTLLQQGDIGLAETYRNGLWEADDLAAFMTLCLKNEAALEAYIKGHPFSRCLARLSYLFRRNTLNGSKRNIEAHYDLGNAFYALWLDPSMTYSSALFQSQGEALQQAQANKYQRILERLHPSGNVLEIGCGWGGFAEHALQQRDYGMKGLTLSHQQKQLAEQRVAGKATIALQDYRHEEGRYDNIVSIEMFEAVGEAYWQSYFTKLAQCLKKQGRAMVQTITIAERYFENYRKGGDFIRTYIFPGGMLPSQERFTEQAKRAGLVLAAEPFHFGQDYALTLQKWLANFEARLAEVRALGFDERFIKIWRLYLAGCIGSFRTGRTSVMQAELRHAA